MTATDPTIPQSVLLRADEVIRREPQEAIMTFAGSLIGIGVLLVLARPCRPKVH